METVSLRRHGARQTDKQWLHWSDLTVQDQRPLQIIILFIYDKYDTVPKTLELSETRGVCYKAEFVSWLASLLGAYIQSIVNCHGNFCSPPKLGPILDARINDLAGFNC